VVDFVREVEADAKGYVGSYGGEGGTMSAYKLLERFNFGGPKQMTRIEDLSGGEQRRLQLLSVLAKCPNFLILDEPTNDLDLDTIEALEELLSDFDGCVIVVSHDRQFVNNLVDHIFVFDGGGQVNDWSGDYTALRQFLKTMEEEREAAKALTGNPDVNPLELTDEEIAEAKARVEDERKILKEAHNAPGVIEKIEAVLEGNIEDIDERLMEAGADVSKAQEIQVERDAKASKMQLYYDEWERLEEVLSRAEEIKAASEETVNA
jgi:ABC-type multidrug transport system ATPase subunit